MDLSALRMTMKLRRLSQSDLAALAGVSRQAVSLWFRRKGKSAARKNFAETNTAVLQKLAAGLRVSAAQLLESPLEKLSESMIAQFETEFLWDRLYPSLEEFVVALVNGETKALARLVQCRGLFYAADVVGDAAWRKFEAYKTFLHPVSRKACERIWLLQRNLGLI